MTDVIPESLNDAASLLRSRAVGETPLSIRTRLLSVAGQESAVDAVVPVAGDVMLGAFLDLPHADVPVSAATLSGWGIDVQRAVELGTQNWGAIDTPLTQVESVMVGQSQALVAAVLAKPDIARQLINDANPVVIVPARGEIVIARASDTAGISMAARIAEVMLSQTDRPVSITPLVAGNGWEKFEWPNPQDPFVSALSRRWDSIQYAALKEALVAHFSATGQDYFVATCSLAKSPAGVVVTYASITEGAATVVPVVDEIALVTDSGKIAKVSFQAVVNSGAIQQIEGISPTMLWVSRFPSELVS